MGWTDCIFDLYGTLVDIRTDEEKPELWSALAEHYAALGAVYTPDALQKAYLRLVHQEEQRLGAGSADTHEAHPEIQLEHVFRAMFAEKGIPADEATVTAAGRRFRELSMAYIRLYPGVPELLKALRAAGKKIWLLSNAQRMFTAYEMDRLGITECFDGIYLSSDYGCKKPDSRFFRILLEERQIPAGSAVMIGNDGRCDIAGAKAVGLATVYIRSNISPKEALPEADCVLPEMDIPAVQKILLNND